MPSVCLAKHLWLCPPKYTGKEVGLKFLSSWNRLEITVKMERLLDVSWMGYCTDQFIACFTPHFCSYKIPWDKRSAVPYLGPTSAG